jgi:hypothetical protein
MLWPLWPTITEEAGSITSRGDETMNKPWFDPQTEMLLLDEYVAAMPSYRKIMADAVVTDEELHGHAHRVMELLRQLEAALPAELKELATDALCELAVLYAVQRKRSEQNH